MGKRHETPPSSSKVTLVVMVVGALLVAGLVGWALTRTVEPAASVTAPASETVATMAPIDTSGLAAPPVTSVPMTTAQNDPSATAPLAPPINPEVANAHTQTPEKAAVPRIAVEDLRAKINRNDVIVVDVRDEGSFERSHIPGAMHIPLASIEANLSQLPKDKPIVTYCT